MKRKKNLTIWNFYDSKFGTENSYTYCPNNNNIVQREPKYDSISKNEGIRQHFQSRASLMNKPNKFCPLIGPALNQSEERFRLRILEIQCRVRNASY